ncbi:GntR family transcriptional regulator [Ruegeria sp. ANG-S4]|uniref:GntR family transcriptional regulator n=1 Tax=Ruegeria sp. ANG-S4 TaxID=1577904 RepID=UPI00057C403B|nr:GntR family transcriptional regulator [Ruegeria sp. ANG-S4]KIC45696.1 GntR family transcriptional regulator [Ruegeria sp. ANG-S4]
MAKRAIERQSLPDVIASDLRERILSGDLIEGETIRQEALAEDYDVSRMPVREALKQLDAEGLVRLATNRGATVTEHSPEEIAEIFDLRGLLEVDLFRRAIPAMTAAQLGLCQDILEQMEASYDANDVAQWGALNQRFHAALYAPARRSLTNELLHRVSLQSDRYIRMHLSVMEQRGLARKEHRELLRLAQAGQTDAACTLLAEHIQRAKNQLLGLMAARIGGAP